MDSRCRCTRIRLRLERVSGVLDVAALILLRLAAIIMLAVGLVLLVRWALA